MPIGILPPRGRSIVVRLTPFGTPLCAAAYSDPGGHPVTGLYYRKVEAPASRRVVFGEASGTADRITVRIVPI